MPRGGKRKGAGRRPLKDQEKKKSKVIRVPEAKFEDIKKLVDGDIELIEESQIKQFLLILDNIKELLSVKAQRNSAGMLLQNRERVLLLIEEHKEYFDKLLHIS